MYNRIEKACDYLDGIVEKLKYGDMSVLFKCKNTINSMFFDGNNLNDFFISIIPNEKLDDIINFLLRARSISFYMDSQKYEYIEGFNKVTKVLRESNSHYYVIAGQKEEINMDKEYDVFISHANKDKKDFVEELYQAINRLGINIFYDKETLEWGDNWKDRILNGTKKSEFAVIVISESFFDREWTERELVEFLNRQNGNGQKLILPILHNITATQLQEKYPTVADIQAIDSKQYTCDRIALMFARQLIRRLKNI